jgi:outer membrane receptor protein involved in Fe transport
VWLSAVKPPVKKGQPVISRYIKTFVLVAFGLLVSPTFAQLSNATIQGTVKTTDGAVLPTATVELTNLDNSAHRTAQSNGSGYYDFEALSPGHYSVKTSAPGFSAWEGKLILRVAQNAEVNPLMKIGSVETTIAVDATPQIDVSDGTISDVKDATRIETLPLVNRNFLNILNFSPGVVAAGYAGQGGGYTRVNGITGGSATFFVDGQSVNDRFTNELQATPQAVPTIQELKVTTSNGSAEYGTPGVIDVVTKGGTNQFHGQLYELYQTGGFQAKFFNNNGNVPHLVHNEFGGQLGGPVRIPGVYNGTDKTFFFFDAERLIEHAQGNPDNTSFTVPQPNWLTGDFHDIVDDSGTVAKIYDPLTTRQDPNNPGHYIRDPFPGNIIPASRINPAAQKIFAVWPRPNVKKSDGTCCVSYTNSTKNYIDPVGSKILNITRYTGKVDQVLGKGILSARYTYVNSPFTKPNGLLLNPNTALSTGNNGTLSLTTPIGSHAVNEVRLGVQLFQNYTGPVPQPGIVTKLGLPPTPDDIAYPGLGVGYAEDYPANGTESSFDPIDRDNPKNAPNQAITLGDNFSLSRGRHELKFGFSVADTRVNTIESSNPGGNYGFNGAFTAIQDPSQSLSANASAPHTGFGFADFYLGLVNDAFVDLVPHFHTRQKDYAGFVQDNWKVTPRLTLNLGARYEYWTPYNDASGIQSNLNFNTAVPSVVTPGVPKAAANVIAQYKALGIPFQTAAQAGVDSSLWNMSKNNISPRVGFAYRVDDKSVLRGGYGIYYWTMPLVQYQQNSRHNLPFEVLHQSFTDGTGNGDIGPELTYPVGPPPFPNQSVGSRDLGKNFVTSSDADVSDPGTGGFRITPHNPNFKAQRVQQYSLTAEREFPYHWTASLGYVGNHGDHLVDFDPINAQVPRLNDLTKTPAQRRMYPLYSASGLGSMDLLDYIGYSNHNQMTAEVKHVFQSSFVLQSYFTWSQTLTTSEGGNKSFGALELQSAALTNNAPQSQRLRAIYARDSQLPALNFGFNGHYELPFGQGKRYLANTNGLVSRVVSGWNTTAFYSWRSGLPFNPGVQKKGGYYSANPQQGSASIILAPGKTGQLPDGERNRNKWFDASIWDPSVSPTYNNQTFIRRDSLHSDYLSNIPRSYLTGPHFYNMDGSVYKITPITEHVFFNLELQVFNVFNHYSLGLPNELGVISSALGTPRLLQFQGKITF